MAPKKLKKVVRTGLTYFPWVVDTKADIQRRWRQIRGRPFEPDFNALSGLLKSGDNCLDIGANPGQSIDAMRLIVPGVKVTSFEPQPDLYGRLTARFGADPDVKIYPFGVGAAAAELYLYVPSYRGYRFDGIASLHEREAREYFRHRIFGYRDDKLSVEQIRCEVVRLDDMDLPEPIRFAKFDIQGGEYDALLGFRDILNRDHPHLLVEAPGDNIHSLLGSLGYRHYAWVNGRLQRNQVGALNTFFLV